MLEPSARRSIADAAGRPAPLSRNAAVRVFDLEPREHRPASRPAREGPILIVYSACVALAFINTRSVWLDEAVGVSIAAQPFGAMLHTLGHVDAVHGLYYSLLHVWMSAGHSAIAIRLPSVLFAVLAAYAVGKLAASMFGAEAAAPAVAILATSTFFLYYADEARPAALTLMLCSFAALFFWRALSGARPRDVVVCGVFFLLSVYADALALLFAFATCVAVAMLALSGSLRAPRATIAATISTAAGVCLGIVPLVIAIHKDSLAQIGWIARSSARQIIYFTASIVGSNEGADRASRIATEFEAAAVLLLMIVGIVAAWRMRATRASVIAALAWLVVPLALGIAIDQWAQPILVARYFSFVLIPAALLAGCGLSVVRQRFGFAAGIAPVALLAAVSIASLALVQREDWRSASAFLFQRSHADDALVFWTPWTVTPFEYAVREKGTAPAAAVAYPNGRLTDAVAFAPPSRAFVRALRRKYNRVWLIESNAAAGPHPFAALSQLYSRRTQTAFPGIVVVRFSR